MTKKSNSEKGFKFALIAIGFLLLFLVFKLLAGTEQISIDVYTYASGFSMLLVVLASIIGFIFNMRGLKDPNSFKKILSLIVNSILILLFITTTIANIMDLISLSK